MRGVIPAIYSPLADGVEGREITTQSKPLAPCGGHRVLTAPRSPSAGAEPFQDNQFAVMTLPPATCHLPPQRAKVGAASWNPFIPFPAWEVATTVPQPDQDSLCPPVAHTQPLSDT